MEIRKEGIYRLTYEYLTGAGLPTGIVSTTLQLFNSGNEAAMKMVSAGGVFSTGDYIEFYAEALDNAYTGTNVYWLYWGSQTGKRVGEIDGTVTGGGTRPSSFTDTLRIEENHTLWEGVPGAPEEDYWFWEKKNDRAQKRRLRIRHPISGHSSRGNREGVLQGTKYEQSPSQSPHPDRSQRYGDR